MSNILTVLKETSRRLIDVWSATLALSRFWFGPRKKRLSVQGRNVGLLTTSVSAISTTSHVEHRTICYNPPCAARRYGSLATDERYPADARLLRTVPAPVPAMNHVGRHRFLCWRFPAAQSEVSCFSLANLPATGPPHAGRRTVAACGPWSYASRPICYAPAETHNRPNFGHLQQNA